MLWPESPKILLSAPQSLEPSVSTDKGVNLLAQIALLAIAVCVFLYVAHGKRPSDNVLMGTFAAGVVAASATIARQNALLVSQQKQQQKQQRRAAAMVGEEEETAPPQGRFLTPAQSTLRASPDNPYGNYRLYDTPQTHIYNGPIAIPENDGLQRMALGTEHLNPDHVFYTLPDSSGIEHRRPRMPHINMGHTHTSDMRGGLWAGR